MNVTLGSELEKLVEEKVARGDYDSPSTLVQEAVQRLLAEDEEELEEMKAALGEALEQSRRGEGRPAKEVFGELRAQYDIPR